jgi:cytochrome c biogenesis protein CcmG/thiol:disulfide interchange protein DsbE
MDETATARTGPGSTGPGSTGPAATRAAGRLARAGRLIRQHKVISSVTALFAAAIIGVSLATTGSSAAPSYPAAPGFTLPALGQAGQQVSLSQYQGRPVIINFWASWCEPCQQETPLLAGWYRQQHGGVALLGLDENDTAAKAVKFATAKGVSYPVGFDPSTKVAVDYGVDALPQTLFLNAQHRIVDHVYGPLTQAALAKGTQLMRASS